MDNTLFPVWGATLSVHPDLVAYIDTLHEYQIKNLNIQSKIRDYVAHDRTEDEICASIKHLVEDDVRKIISELSKYGVYNKTISDFLPTDYYDAILRAYHSDVTQDTEKTADEYYQAITSAREAADSSVTGLPFGVISNSIIGIGVYALQEQSEIKKQQARADASFFRQSQRLEQTYKNAVDSAISEHRIKFISCMSSATEAMYDSFAAAHLTELAYCGKFDIAALDGISINRSSELLENLSVVNSKTELLRQALILCPFNARIYAKAAEVGLFNKQLCDLASYLHISDSVIQTIECISEFESKQTLSPSKIIKQCKLSCEAISMISDETPDQTWQRYFPDIADRIKQSFQHFSSFLLTQESSENFCLQRFSAMYEGQLKQYREDHDCSEFIQNCTCSEKDVHCLIVDFGYRQIEAEIAKIVGYSGGPQYYSILQFMERSVNPLLTKALSYIDSEQQKQQYAVRTKQENEALEKEHQKKQYKRSRKLTNIACISLIIGVVGILFGFFWIPLSVVGLVSIAVFACVSIYLKFFDPYGWSS